MKYLLFLPLAVALLTACSKSDKEQIAGTWSIQELKKDGVLAMSIDAKEQDEILERTWKEQGALYGQMGVDKATVKANFQREAKMLSKITFVFDEKGKVTVSANDGKTKATNSPYKVDEAKKQLSIEEPGKKKLTYNYIVSETQLTLKEKKDEIVLKRK